MPPVVGVAATIPLDRWAVPAAIAANVGATGAAVIVVGGIVFGLEVTFVGWYLVVRLAERLWRRWVDRDDDAAT